MGNIVSSATPYGQSSRLPGDVVLATQTSPSLNRQSSVITVPNPNVIEAVGQTGQVGGYHTDPFGTLPSIPTIPPTPTIPTVQANTPPSITPEPVVPLPEPLITQPANTTPDPRQETVLVLFNRMPDIYQMMKDLEKSGCLLPELQIKSTERLDTSPLAALQPQRLKDQRFFSAPTEQELNPLLPEVRLTATGIEVAKHPAQFTELPMFFFVSLISLIQSIQGFAQVIHFAVITYPQYEQLVIATQLTTTQVNTTVIKAMIVGIFAFLGFVMGLILFFKKARNQSLLLYGVITLILFNFFAQNVMVRKEFASGNPLVLPEIVSQVISKNQSVR